MDIEREKMENIAIDLLWLRPGKVGGTESFIRNLLDGFMELQEEFLFTLLVSSDNAYSFKKYENDPRYSLLIADVQSSNIAKRIMWQNIHQNRFLRKNGIKKCFEPVYCKPWLNGGIEYTCVIHDLQAYHYPEYHPLHEVLFSKLCWKMDVLNAKRIAVISNWVKSDLLSRYKCDKKEIRVIYNPVTVKKNEVLPYEILEQKYNLKSKNFYYTVAQMIPHKNLKTLIMIIDKIKREKINLPTTLVITGINGNGLNDIIQLINNLGVQENIIFTGYIDLKERNALYKECCAFLFPSVFEGFGMPLIEAMMFESTVITTECTSIPEITQNKANYVEDPYDVDNWIRIMKNPSNFSRNVDFDRYDKDRISKEYLDFIQK